MRNMNQGGFRRMGPREEHDATCSACQKTCKVPFKPHPDKPVFCQDCWKERRNDRERN